MSEKRPNILVIMSDEHDAAVLGCYGDKIVQTPHLDGLAERGVTFDAAYCNSPLCAPSRLSFTTGKYISRIGGWSNDCRLPSDVFPSIARLLNDVGYESFLVGKQHYDRAHRYGFTDLLPETKINLSKKTGKINRREPENLSSNARGWEQRAAEFYIGDHSNILDTDRAVTHTARGFLGARTADAPPFFLFAGYQAPHFPMIVPKQYAEKYLGTVPPPNIPEGLIENLPLNYKHLRSGFGVTETDPEVVQKGRDLYWALTNWFDDEVGKLLAALKDSAVADNTIVIYTSDHGENKGDHGLWWKNCMYDHGARVPLIVSWPARWAGGQRRSGACSLVDVVQAIAEIAGADTPEDWDGDSLVPYLDDAEYSWKDFALSEYYGHNIASGFTLLRQGDWKYTYHNRMDENHGPERELYNVKADPEELQNLAGAPAQSTRIEAMHNTMRDELGEEPDEIELRCRAEGARGYAQNEPEA